MMSPAASKCGACRKRTNVPFASQIFQLGPGPPQRELRVAPRHELIVGEDDVPLLAADHHLIAAEVKHIVGHTGRTHLPYPPPRRFAVAAEQDRVVLGRGSEVSLEVGDALEHQHLLADQEKIAVAQLGARLQTNVDAVSTLETAQGQPFGPRTDPGVPRRQIRIVEKEVSFRSTDLDSASPHDVGGAVGAVMMNEDQPKLVAGHERLRRGIRGWHQRQQSIFRRDDPPIITGRSGRGPAAPEAGTWSCPAGSALRRTPQARQYRASGGFCVPHGPHLISPPSIVTARRGRSKISTRSVQDQCEIGERSNDSVGAAGFEPTTPGFGGRYSIQMSYAPGF